MKKQQTGKDIKIPHHRSNQFTSHFATGVIMGGPTPDGMNHLIFYSDVIGVNSETGTEIAPGVFKAAVQLDDIQQFREDKARISMRTESLKSLYNVLRDRFGTEPKVDAK